MEKALFDPINSVLADPHRGHRRPISLQSGQGRELIESSYYRSKPRDPVHRAYHPGLGDRYLSGKNYHGVATSHNDWPLSRGSFDYIVTEK